MAKRLNALLKVAAAAAGVFVVGKYLHDYTDYKLAEKKDLDDLKKGGEKAKEAAKRAYIAIKTGEDVNPPAGDLGTAVAEMAGGAEKLLNAAGENTKQFAKNEKEKYVQDPVAYRAKVVENMKDMGQHAAGVFQGIRDDAEGIISDIRETADSFRNDPEDFVDSRAEESAADSAEGASFTEVKEEPLYKEADVKQYAELAPAEKAAFVPEEKPAADIEVTEDPVKETK